MAQQTNPPLITLKTDLRTLRYSNSGFTNQPYIKTSLLKDFTKETGAVTSFLGGNGGLNQEGPLQRVLPGSPDFLLRDNAVQSSLNDVSRLSQYMVDFQAGGPLFIAKQNLLSLANVNITAGYDKPKTINSSNITIGNGGIIGNALSSAANNIVDFVKTNVSPNQGIYSPLGTIAQAGVSAIGFHLNKQGLNPFVDTTVASPLGNTPLGMPTYLNTISTSGIEPPRSRVEQLLIKQTENTENLELYKYIGGPGANLGVGQTSINIEEDQRTIISYNNSAWNPFSSGTIELPYLNRFVLTQQEIETIKPVSQGGKLNNFSALIAPTGSTDIPRSLPWGPAKIGDAPTSENLAYRIDERVNLGDPGKRGNISSYTIGKRDPLTTISGSISNNSGYKNALDKINAFPLYQSGAVTGDTTKNDLVKFRIGVIDNNNPNLKTYIHFRAFIDSMSDSYTSDWEVQKFMGRGENFYKYSGFDRSISLSWTVAARSKQELIPMYQKLNYLASVCAPDYSNNGYMRGNLISLTLGGWCYEQVGIMRGITLDVPTESPWEVGLNDSGQGGTEGDSASDSSVKELPMIIKVTGFTFTPIHDFVPKVQQNSYKGPNGSISEYGKERYLALQSVGDNYTGDEFNLNYIPKAPSTEVVTTEPQTTPRSGDFPGGPA